MIKVFFVLNRVFFLTVIFALFLPTGKSNAQSKDSTAVLYHYYINSSPFNAEVYYKDSLIGLTPVRLTTQEKLSGNIVFKKKNFQNSVFDLAEYNFDKGVEIILKSLLPSEEKIVLKNRETDFAKKRNFGMLALSGFAALTSGTFAYNLKQKANDFYNHYLDDRNPDNLDKSKRYDVFYGISVGILQASIAGLIYFLLLE